MNAISKNISSIPVTALDVFRLLPKGTRAEVINNVLYMSPSPLFNHQQLVTKLTGLIWKHLESKAGELLVAPFDVYLENHASAVQPDILFIANKNLKILKDDGYAHGAPDMIIEILSMDEARDKTLKKELYEKSGVKEYFIIDPKSKLAEAYILKNRKYQLAYSSKRVFRSVILKMEFSF